MAQSSSKNFNPTPEQKRKAAQTVLCAPERFINIPTSDLQTAFQGRLNDSNFNDFSDLCKLFEANSHLDFIAIGRRVKDNFRLFSAAARGIPLPLRKGTSLPSANELDQVELKFLEDFCNLLKTAHYRLLTQEEWETATDEEYTFNMPIEISWEYMDTQLLQRFWSGHPHLQQGTADISERMLVFHRGVHTAHSRGLYVEDKIDLLMGYCIVNPLASLAGKFLGYKAKEKAKAYSPLTSNNQHSAVADLSRGEGVHDTGTAQARGLEHANAKVVKRVTLQRLMPDAASTFAQLFTRLEIQEPCFTDLVVLYRKSKSVLERPSSEKDQLPRYSKDMAQRNIVVKSFTDVPMADVEMIFPEKKVFIKPFVLIQLVVTVVLAAITVFSTLFQNKVSWAVLSTVLSVAVARGAQVWSRAQLTRQQMQDAMVDGLYEKAADSQEGVLHTVLDEMCDQHTREIIIAYAVLLMRGEPLTQEALDKRCEIWLDRIFGQKLDFAIENSLPVCLEDGIIKRDSEGLLSALPPGEALKILKRKWERHFDTQASGGPDPKVLGAEPITQEQPYDMSITAEQPVKQPEPEPQPTPAAGGQPYQGGATQRRPAAYDQGPAPQPQYTTSQNASGQYGSGSGQYSSGAGQYGSGSGHRSSGSGSYSIDPVTGRVIIGGASTGTVGQGGSGQGGQYQGYSARLGNTPADWNTGASDTASHTTASTRASEVAYAPGQSQQQGAGASRFQGEAGNGQTDTSGSDANGASSEVRHPHLQRLADHVPFVHHGSRS